MNAFGNGYFRWEPISGSVFTHVLIALDPAKDDFGKRWLVHATGARFPVSEDDTVQTWFPCRVDPRTMEVVRF